MIARKNPSPELRYRKRPEPCRVVSLDSLKRTESNSKSNDGPFVSHKGSIEEFNSWNRISNFPIVIEVSKRSWEGLHNRMTSSMARAEVV